MILTEKYLRSGFKLKKKKDNVKCSKRLAVFICVIACMMTLVTIAERNPIATIASEIAELKTSVGTYYGVEPYDDYSRAAFYFNCGDQYIGNWSNRKFSGLGEYKYDKLGTYNGYFENGVRKGTGTFEWLDGSYYAGEWCSDKITGQGRYVSASGYSLDGIFKDNKFIKGCMTYTSNDNVYKYDIKAGKYSSQVLIEYKDGTTYRGKYKNSSIVSGTIHYSNGDKYVGDFKDGLKSGIGIYTWKSGAYYVGTWKKDVMNGEGTYYYESGSRGISLQGTYVNNRPNGRCVYKSHNGNSYITLWKNGKCTKVERNY